MDWSVAVLVDKIDVNIFAVTTEQVLKLCVVAVLESIVELGLFIFIKMF